MELTTCLLMLPMLLNCRFCTTFAIYLARVCVAVEYFSIRSPRLYEVSGCLGATHSHPVGDTTVITNYSGLSIFAAFTYTSVTSAVVYCREVRLETCFI